MEDTIGVGVVLREEEHGELKIEEILKLGCLKVLKLYEEIIFAVKPKMSKLLNNQINKVHNSEYFI